MWDLLGGMGKSRVVHTMALMLLLQGYERVHIVLPTQSLVDREMNEFNDFFRGDESGRVSYHMDFEFEMKDDEIIISDEADYLMFKNPVGFFAKARSYPMISMTASVPLTDTKSLE
jgi:reverse gyrase